MARGVTESRAHAETRACHCHCRGDRAVAAPAKRSVGRRPPSGPVLAVPGPARSDWDRGAPSKGSKARPESRTLRRARAPTPTGSGRRATARGPGASAPRLWTRRDAAGGQATHGAPAPVPPPPTEAHVVLPRAPCAPEAAPEGPRRGGPLAAGPAPARGPPSVPRSTKTLNRVGARLWGLSRSAGPYDNTRVGQSGKQNQDTPNNTPGSETVARRMAGRRRLGGHTGPGWGARRASSQTWVQWDLGFICHDVARLSSQPALTWKPKKGARVPTSENSNY